MLNRLVRLIALKLEERAREKGNVLYITERDDPTSVYLVRYPIFNNSVFGLYVHRFLRSDSADPHDHPFDFVSYVVSGEYTEKLYTNKNVQYYSFGANKDDYLDIEPQINVRKPGSIVFRHAKQAHVVTVPEEIYSKDEYQKGTMTIILRGPRRRQWGFHVVQDVYKRLGFMWTKWVHFQEYTPDHSYKTNRDALQ